MNYNDYSEEVSRQLFYSIEFRTLLGIVKGLGMKDHVISQIVAIVTMKGFEEGQKEVDVVTGVINGLNQALMLFTDDRSGETVH